MFQKKKKKGAESELKFARQSWHYILMGDTRIYETLASLLSLHRYSSLVIAKWFSLFLFYYNLWLYVIYDLHACFVIDLFFQFLSLLLLCSIRYSQHYSHILVIKLFSGPLVHRFNQTAYITLFFQQSWVLLITRPLENRWSLLRGLQRRQVRPCWTCSLNIDKWKISSFWT